MLRGVMMIAKIHMPDKNENSLCTVKYIMMQVVCECACSCRFIAGKYTHGVCVPSPFTPLFLLLFWWP